MGSSSIVSLSNAVNYPRYTRVINGDVIFAKDNIWLNNHKVRIGGSFSDTARMLNKHSAKTGVKAEVVQDNNVARLKLTVRERNLTIHDPKGIFSSLGKNIGASDKTLVQIVCRGKVSWSYNRPATHLLTVHSLISEDNKKLLNKCRQAHNQVHDQEEIEDHHVDVDSDDEQQLMVKDDFATDPLSPPSLLLGSAPRFRVIDLPMSSLAEMEDDLVEVDSGDEQQVVVEDDFATNPLSPPSLLLGSAPRWSIQSMPSLLGEMEDDLVEADSGDEQQVVVEDDFATPLSSQSRLRRPGSQWSIQSMPSFQSEQSSLDKVETDPSAPRLDPFVTPTKKGNSAVVGSRLRPGPRWSIEQPRSDSFATLVKGDAPVAASKSAPSRRTLHQSRNIPGVTPPARKHSSIKGKGEAELDFRAKLKWLEVRGRLPAKYASGEDRSAILSLYDAEHSKAPSLKSSRIAPPSATPPARKFQSIKGRDEADRAFRAKLKWLEVRGRLPAKYASGEDRSAILSLYDAEHSKAPSLKSSRISTTIYGTHSGAQKVSEPKRTWSDTISL